MSAASRVAKAAAGLLGVDFHPSFADAAESSSDVEVFVNGTSAQPIAAFMDGTTMLFDGYNPSAPPRAECIVFVRSMAGAVSVDNFNQTVTCINTGSPAASQLHSLMAGMFSMSLSRESSGGGDERLHRCVREMEASLATLARRSGMQPVGASTEQANESSVGGILSPKDEGLLWRSIASSPSTPSVQRQRAGVFASHLEELSSHLDNPKSMSLDKLETALGKAEDCMKALWAGEGLSPGDKPYPEARMEHLVKLIGDVVVQFVRSNCLGELLWSKQLVRVRRKLEDGQFVLNSWKQRVLMLYRVDWSMSSARPLRALGKVAQVLSRQGHNIGEAIALVSVVSELKEAKIPGSDAMNVDELQGTDLLATGVTGERQWKERKKKVDLLLSAAEAGAVQYIGDRTSHWLASLKVQ